MSYDYTLVRRWTTPDQQRRELAQSHFVPERSPVFGPPTKDQHIYERLLNVRRRLAAWVSANGAQDSATCDLIDVLEDMDCLLDILEFADA